MLQTKTMLILSFSIVLSLVGWGGAKSNQANAQTPSLSTSKSSAQSPSATACTDAKKPVITKPLDGGTVVLTDIIRGTTPCTGMKHYVVVTPPNGVNWVQAKSFNISANGAFIAEAQFGEGSNGIKEKYLVRILVTKATLMPGQLNQMPSDAILSGAISVTREQ